MTSLKKNFIYNTTYQILLIVLPLVTAPYLSRVLGAAQLGEYSFSFSVANYFVLFGMLGVNNYGNRCVARVRNDKHLLSSEFWSIYLLQIIVASISLLVYVAYSLLSSNRLLALIWVSYVASAALDVNWLFFGLEEFRLTVTRNLAIKIATFLLTLTLVRGECALIIYCTLMAISLLISSAVLWPFVFKKVDFVKPSSNEIIKHLKPNLTLFVPVIAVSLYTVLDKVMLGAMSSFEETGYFENAYKVATMPTAVITALGTVMLPRVSGLLAEDKREEARGYLGVSMWAAMAMAFAFSFGVAGVASVLVPVLFGDGFAPSEAAMCVIVADMPFMAWANVLRTQMLIPEGRDREYVSSVVAGAAVNVVVNLVLIPRFGALGASAGTFCAEAAVCLVQARAVRLDVPQGRWLLRCLPFVVVGAVMCIAVRALGAALGASSLTLLLQVFVGAAIYSLLSLAWCVTSRDEGYESLVRPVLEGVAKRLWGGR